MLYQRKRMDVNAVKLKSPMVVGGRTGMPGDYLVTFADDSVSIISGPVFEGNFEPVIGAEKQAFVIIPGKQDEPPKPPMTEPLPTGFICVGCQSETVPEHLFDKNTGLCATCLKKQVVCQTCGLTVQQFEVIGSYCRRCLKS